MGTMMMRRVLGPCGLLVVLAGCSFGLERPLSDGPPPIPCETRDDCPPSHDCEPGARAGEAFCAFACESDADCPETSTCERATGHCVCSGALNDGCRPPGADGA